jgi:outer membrane protein assembly factor BamB
VANGVLYVPAVNDTIAAYNAATGAVLWTSPVITSGGIPSVAQPAIVNGILYTGGTAGLYAFAPGA